MVKPMFVFQAGKKAQKIREEEIPPKQIISNFLAEQGMSLGGARDDFFNFIEKKGKSATNPYLSIEFRAGEEEAAKFAKALTGLRDYIAKYFGVDIKIKQEGNIVSLERTDVKPPEITGVPTKLPPGKAYQAPSAAKKWEEIDRAKEELSKKYPTVVEFRSSQEKDSWLSQRDPNKEEWEVVGPFVREFDDTLHAKRVEVYAVSMGEYTKTLEFAPDYIHAFGFHIYGAETYNAKNPLEVRDLLGKPGGFLAAVYNAQADFLTPRKDWKTFRECAKNPVEFAAFLSSGWTGALKFDGRYDVTETRKLHRKKIEELMRYAGGSFDNLRGVLPDADWAAFKTHGELMADYAIQLGLISTDRKKEYANAFAFGMLEIVYYESGLSTDQLFAWFRGENRGVIDPDKVITTIMKTRDDYRLFYGGQEITSPAEIVFSPYMDLMITKEDGKTPLAHLRITHSKWLGNIGAWEGNRDYKGLFRSGLFVTSLSKWSWLGIGMTSYYHPVRIEITFDIVLGAPEEVWLIGVKPIEPPHVTPPEMVDAFSIVGNREFRLIGTQFKTDGTILAYGDKSINDLKQDENFSLDYIAYSSPLPKQKTWFPGLREKEKRYFSYIILPAGENIKDRLPPGISNYDRGMQNGALIYEDYRYDLILTINGGRTNVPPGISKSLIDKGLQPTDLLSEINPDGTLDIYVYLNEKGEIVKDPAKHKGPKYVEVLASGVRLSETDLAAIRSKDISDFASFEDNGRTGLDLYAVVKINKDGTTTLVDAANIAGHEFDYKFMYESGYAKQYLGSLPSSRVVVTATGEKSYHIMPTDIHPDWRDLLVGTIPRELIRVSADGKKGEFTAKLDKNVAVQKGIRAYYVSYYMNYSGKTPISSEFAGLPVSVKTLASEDAATRKSAIAQLISLSQNPVSAEEASNYMGLISEVEAKWRDRLDLEDRRNLAAARANLERYSGMVGAGETAAGVSERTPIIPKSQYTLSMNQQSIIGLTTADIPSQWDRIWNIEDDQEKIKRFGDALHALGLGLVLDAAGNSEEAKKCGREFLSNFISDPKDSFDDLTDAEKNTIGAMVYGEDYDRLNETQKTNVAQIYSWLITGNIKDLLESDIIKSTNLEGVVDPLRSKMEFLSKINENVVTVGGVFLEWKSGGVVSGELGAPTGGLAGNLGAIVNFIDTEYKSGRLRLIKIEETDPETGEKTTRYAYGGLDITDKTRLAVEPALIGDVTVRLPSGMEITGKGGVGYRVEVEKGAAGRGRWTSNVGLQVGNIRIPYTNVVLLINGDWKKLPALRGMEERTTVSGTGSFILMVPHSLTVGYRRSLYTNEGEQQELSPTGVENTAFAVLHSTLFKTREGTKLSSNLSAEFDRLSRQGWKRFEIGGEYQVVPGKTFYVGVGRVNTQLGKFNTLRFGVGLEF